MPTVFVTVHGTGDSAPALSKDEAKWWEPRSKFCEALIERADGNARIESFVWSGKNDELERRRAARRLYENLSSFNDVDVVVVGHSHGGSVVHEALNIAASRNQSLPRLVRWITVGTPFIKMRRKRFAFNRLNLVGQAALACALPVAIGFLISVPSTFAVFMRDGLYLAQPGIGYGVALACLLAIILPEEIRSQRRASPRFAQQIVTRFGERWRGCVSRHDEATNGLEGLPRLSMRVFGRDSLRTAIRFSIAAIFIGNLLISTIAGNSPIETLLPLGIYDLHMIDLSQTDFLTWYRSIPSTLTYDAVAAIDQYAKDNFGSGLFPQSETDGYSAFVDFTFGPIIALFWTFLHMIAAMFIAQILLARTIGEATASFLNGAMRSAILKVAYGNSNIEATATGSSDTPFKDAATAMRLPERVDAELLAYAKAHAAETISGFRQELFDETFARRDGGLLVEALLQKLSWRELVHTAYFRVDESRAYIANLAAGTPGNK